MGRDLRRKAVTGTILRVFEDRSRLVEWDNGRQQRVPFMRCPACKIERPSAEFTMATCYTCRGIAIEPPRGFSCTKNGRTVTYSSERYAKLRQATPPWVKPTEIRAIYKEAKRISKETGIPHQVDHIWPLVHESFSGLHVPWNLRIIPSKNNMSKHNKPPVDFLQQITPNQVGS